MTPFEVYKTYLALKNHFTKDNYDYHKYCGKVRASLQSFYKRKDRFWFEKLSRQKSEKEVIDFFVSNFVSSGDPQRLWIGDIIREGEKTYISWNGKIQSLTYLFKSEVESVISIKDFNETFEVKGSSHPLLLKEHLQGNLSLETMVILNRILGYKTDFDKKLQDPVWGLVSKNMNKYDSFLNIDVFKFKKILRDCIL
tara:strand:+ start:5820 stop:6410 length:591 start_codon:yes stop_codon:yes gene_type:complete